MGQLIIPIITKSVCPVSLNTRIWLALCYCFLLSITFVFWERQTECVQININIFVWLFFSQKKTFIYLCLVIYFSKPSLIQKMSIKKFMCIQHTHGLMCVQTICMPSILVYKHWTWPSSCEHNTGQDKNIGVTWQLITSQWEILLSQKHFGYTKIVISIQQIWNGYWSSIVVYTFLRWLKSVSL